MRDDPLDNPGLARVYGIGIPAGLGFYTNLFSDGVWSRRVRTLTTSVLVLQQKAYPTPPHTHTFFFFGHIEKLICLIRKENHKKEVDQEMLIFFW